MTATTPRRNLFLISTAPPQNRELQTPGLSAASFQNVQYEKWDQGAPFFHREGERRLWLWRPDARKEGKIMTAASNGEAKLCAPELFRKTAPSLGRAAEFCGVSQAPVYSLRRRP
jgi:hypothetical protein